MRPRQWAISAVSLVTDFDQGGYVLKDAVRDRRKRTGKAMFELSFLASGHRALERINDSIDALTSVMSATSELGEARWAATRWR